MFIVFLHLNYCHSCRTKIVIVSIIFVDIHLKFLHCTHIKAIGNFDERTKNTVSISPIHLNCNTKATSFSVVFFLILFLFFFFAFAVTLFCFMGIQWFPFCVHRVRAQNMLYDSDMVLRVCFVFVYCLCCLFFCSY